MYNTVAVATNSIRNILRKQTLIGFRNQNNLQMDCTVQGFTLVLASRETL